MWDRVFRGGGGGMGPLLVTAASLMPPSDYSLGLAK